MNHTDTTPVNDEKDYCRETRSLHWLKGTAGFTLIELVITFGLIAVLAAIAISTFGTIKQKVLEARTMEELRGIEQAISGYVIEKGDLPDSLNDLGQGAFLDPWKHPVVYVNIAKGGVPRKDVAVVNVNTDYDLYSNGADNLTHQLLSHSESDDDILRGANGGFVGLGANY